MRRKVRKSIILLVNILLFLIVVFLVLFSLNKKEEIRFYHSETVLPSKINDIFVFTKFVSKDSKRRPYEKREIKYIVIHETDNTNVGTNAAKHSQFLLTNDESITGWHYTVDDKEIYHNLPDNEISWHAGDKRTADGGNMNGVGIEMCVNEDGDYEQMLKNTVQLVAYLMKEYDLTIDDIKLHRDFSGKICPARLINENRLDEFYKMIEVEYEGLK